MKFFHQKNYLTNKFFSHKKMSPKNLFSQLTCFNKTKFHNFFFYKKNFFTKKLFSHFFGTNLWQKSRPLFVTRVKKNKTVTKLKTKFWWKIYFLLTKKFGKNNLTPKQPMRLKRGSILRSHYVKNKKMSNATCLLRVMCHVSCVRCNISPVTCQQRQQPQPQTLPLIPPPLWRVGWLTKTETKIQ